MQCHRRSSEGQTLFVVTDVDDREREAAFILGWQELENGVGVAFPAGTRYLEEAFANFEAHAYDLVHQRIDTDSIPWQIALSRALAVVGSLPPEWYLVGSAALAARGVDIVPGDIDLVTDAAGAYVLESALRPHLVQPVVVTPHWVAVYFGRSFLDAGVEWVGAVNDTADQPAPSDFGPVAAARLETIHWNGYAIRVPPLDLQIEANRRRGRVERVERIKNWTDSRQSP